jgi:hypothetical protein
MVRLVESLGLWQRRGCAANRANTVLIAGLPRSGTSLACRLLSGLPNVVALNEPMEISKLAGIGAAAQLSMVRNFATGCRRSLLRKGIAPSLQVKGKVTADIFSGQVSSGGTREFKATMGTVSVRQKLSADFTLVMKHNLGFAAIMSVLAPEFSCFGIIRNPLSVLASWRTISTPLSRGHAPVAEMIDLKLAAELSKISDETNRQIHILNWLFDNFSKALPEDRIIRYEDVIASGGDRLKIIVPSAEFSEDLASRNRNPLYDRSSLEQLWNRLRRNDGIYRRYYPIDEIGALFDSIASCDHDRG